MEWTVVTVLIAVVGLALAVGRPMISLGREIQELITTVEHLHTDIETLQRDLKDFIDKNARAHTRIWDKFEDVDKRIDRIEKLIHNLHGKDASSL